jgi:hypothetical protein
MQRGHAHLRMPFWSAMHSWVTSMKATFQPDSPEFGAVDVLGDAERRVAYRCYRCGFLTLTGTPWTPPAEAPNSSPRGG